MTISTKVSARGNSIENVTTNHSNPIGNSDAPLPVVNNNNSSNCDHNENVSSRLNELLVKLQTMVPNMPRERQLTTLETLNYVIDYIRELSDLAIERGNQVRMGLSVNGAG